METLEADEKFFVPREQTRVLVSIARGRRHGKDIYRNCVEAFSANIGENPKKEDQNKKMFRCRQTKRWLRGERRI